MANQMDPARTLSSCPITACGILGWMWWQYGWKRKSRELKGEDRRAEVERQKVGEEILQLTICSVLIAFAHDGIRAWTYAG